MAAPRVYKLDELIDETLKVEGSPYKNRQELLDLLGNAHFEQRELAGLDCSTVALQIGLWKALPSSDGSWYWAVIIDDDISYRLGDGKALSVPVRKEPKAPYIYRKAQLFELRAPFRYITPAAFKDAKDAKEAWKQADLHLDAMIKVLSLREDLVSSIGAKEGDLLSQFQKVVNILHVQCGNIKAKETVNVQRIIPEHDHEGSRALSELSIHSPKRSRPAETQEPDLTPSKKLKKTTASKTKTEYMFRMEKHLQDLEKKNASLRAKLEEADKRMSDLEAQLADADQELAALKAEVVATNKDCDRDISELSCQFKEKWDEAQEQHRVELLEAVQEKKKKNTQPFAAFCRQCPELAELVPARYQHGTDWKIVGMEMVASGLLVLIDCSRFSALGGRMS